MKSLKRIISVIMVFVLIACSMTVAAYAKSEDEEIVANVYCEENGRIDKVESFTTIIVY